MPLGRAVVVGSSSGELLRGRPVAALQAAWLGDLGDLQPGLALGDQHLHRPWAAASGFALDLCSSDSTAPRRSPQPPARPARRSGRASARAPPRGRLRRPLRRRRRTAEAQAAAGRRPATAARAARRGAGCRSAGPSRRARATARPDALGGLGGLGRASSCGRLRRAPVRAPRWPPRARRAAARRLAGSPGSSTRRLWRRVGRPSSSAGVRGSPAAARRRTAGPARARARRRVPAPARRRSRAARRPARLGWLRGLLDRRRRGSSSAMARAATGGAGSGSRRMARWAAASGAGSAAAVPRSAAGRRAGSVDGQPARSARRRSRSSRSRSRSSVVRSRSCRDRSPRAKVRTLTRSGRQPALEEVGGRAGVLAGARGHRSCAGPSGGEALVVHLHRHLLAERPARRSAKRGSRGSARCRPRRGQRQPDHHELGLPLGGQLRSVASPRLLAGRATGSIGVTIVPVGSLTAQPQRALP